MADVLESKSGQAWQVTLFDSLGSEIRRQAERLAQRADRASAFERQGAFIGAARAGRSCVPLQNLGDPVRNYDAIEVEHGRKTDRVGESMVKPEFGGERMRE